MKVEKFKTGERKTILKTAIFHVESVAVEAAISKKKAEYHLIKCFDWINVIALTPKNEIVLVRQFRLGPNEVNLEIPGGALDSDSEDALAAAKREFEEETGYRGENWRFLGKVMPNPACQENFCHTFFCENAIPFQEQNLDAMEEIEVLTMPYDEFRRKVFSGEINHALVMAATALYENMKNSVD